MNEADHYVMEMEIEAAAAHGVNVFIYDWYWYDKHPFLEQCLNNGYLKARNNDKVKFFLMWANHTATTLWHRATARDFTPIWDGAVDRKTFDFIVERTIKNYFSHPSYYKIEGRPVYMLYDVKNLVRGLGGVEKTLEALAYFREETVKAGFPGLDLHLTIRSAEYRATKLDEKTTILDFINMAGFDGVTHYNFFDFAPMNRTYTEILEDVKAEWERVEKNVKAPLYPNVSLGWDNTTRFMQSKRKWLCLEDTPENVEKGFRLAKDYVDSHDMKAPLIVVNSWNEWTEGGYFHPDDRYGYGHLEAAKRVFLDEEE